MKIPRALVISLSAGAGALTLLAAALFFSPEATPQQSEFESAAPAETTYEPSELTVTSTDASLMPLPPPISWEPDHLTVTLSPGETKQVLVVARTRSGIPATIAELVPELSPYVTVEPSALGVLSAGSTATFELSLSVASGTPFQTIDGTLQLRTGSPHSSRLQLVEPSGSIEGLEEPMEDQPETLFLTAFSGSTIARPLPITLNVWPTVEIGDLGVNVNYPPSFVPVLSATDPDGAIGFYESLESFSDGMPATFSVTVDTISAGLTLGDWISTFTGSTSGVTEVTLGGMTYLRWFEDTGEGRGITSFSTLLDSGRVLSFSSPSLPFVGGTQFLQIITSLDSM